jgi:hypothetical protein
MKFLKKIAQNVTDRVAYGLGDRAALGRLDLAAATDILTTSWLHYAGRKGVRQPTIGDLLHYLRITYDIDETVIFGEDTTYDEDTTARVDIDVIMPRIADILMDECLLEIERR